LSGGVGAAGEKIWWLGIPAVIQIASITVPRCLALRIDQFPNRDHSKPAAAHYRICSWAPPRISLGPVFSGDTYTPFLTHVALAFITFSLLCSFWELVYSLALPGQILVPVPSLHIRWGGYMASAGPSVQQTLILVF
jgi:hypothetical protein